LNICAVKALFYFIIIFLHGLGRLTCSGFDAFPFYLIRRYPRLCVFAYGYFIFLEKVTSTSAKPPFLEDHFVSLSLASFLRSVRLGRPYQEHEVPAGIARKIIRPARTPLRQGGDNRGSYFT